MKYRVHTTGRSRIPATGRIAPGILYCTVLILLLFIAVPASASGGDIITLNPGDSIQNAIDHASSGDIIILNPGTYPNYSITVTKNITISANTSYGGTAENTIIDGKLSGSPIFTVQSNIAFMIDNLTLKDGYANTQVGSEYYFYGGAIRSFYSDLTITNSRFSNCSARNDGGAISTSYGTLTIISSSFTGCSAGYDGGAIKTMDNIVTITSSTFTDCTAQDSGAISASHNCDMTITSSAFTDCELTYGGGAAIYALSGSTVRINSSAFTRCSAPGGGALRSSKSTWFITSSTFTGCAATGYNGGAISSESTSTFTIGTSVFSHCTASQSGGAISTGNGGNLTVSSSTFSDCSAGSAGGAIYSSGSTDTITSSTFTGCAGYGSVYRNSPGSTTRLHFCRFVNNSGTMVINADSWSTTNATNNWWGSNTDPSGHASGGATVSPWLVLTAGSSSPSITTGQTAVIYANLKRNSQNIDTSASGNVPNAIPVSFTRTSGSGTLAPGNGNTMSGVNRSTFTPAGAGISSIAVRVDNQVITMQVAAASQAPVANFNGTPRGGAAPLTVQFRDLSANVPVSWKWTFGDGSSVNSTLQNPVHTYLVPGNYSVALQATNALGTRTITKTAYITVAAGLPPTVNGIAPAAGKRGALVWITNLSGTGFRSGAKVFVNRSVTAIPATNVTVVSGKKITCSVKIPAGSSIGPWNLTVVNPDGKSGMKANAFTVRALTAPTVNGITPAVGKQGRLVVITNLSGTGFIGTPKPTVQLIRSGKSITATNVSVKSASRITCTIKIPATVPAGLWNVRVTNADGQSGAKAGAFTVKI